MLGRPVGGRAAHGPLSRNSPGQGGAGAPRNSLLINTFNSAVPFEAQSSSTIFPPVSEFPQRLESILDSTPHQCRRDCGAPLIHSCGCDLRELRLETAHDLAQARRPGPAVPRPGASTWRAGPGQSEAGTAQAGQHPRSDVAPASRLLPWLLASSPAAGTSHYLLFI